MPTPVLNQRHRFAFFNFLKELNLFESESDDVETIRRQRLSTRLYLVLMSVFIITLIIYAALLSRTITITISRPAEDEFQKLFDRYPETLTCPCSRISIQYHEFIRSQVTFHEVCQSQFITQEWINAIYSANVTFIPPNDIRTTISAFWQFVRSFCDLSKNILIDVYTDFNATFLLSPTVQAQVFIEKKIETSLNFSLTSALSSLKRNLLIVRGSTVGNGLFSGLATNYYLHLANGWSIPVYPKFEIDANSFEDGCSCSNFNGCPRPAGIFSSNGTSNWTQIPGMIFDCLVSDAVLASSLQCFYEAWCLSLIQQEIPINATLQPLNMPSRFVHNVTLQTLLDELMIEQLSTIVIFPLYYTHCNPDYCTYSYSRKFDALFIITLVLSAFGGVSIVLRLVTLVLIKLIFAIHRWKIRHRSVGVGDIQEAANHDRPVNLKLRSLFGSIRNLLLNLNLFKSSSRNNEIVYRQRIITRVFVVCLAISLVITSLYAFLSTQNKIISIPSPSRVDYERLLDFHSDTLQCSCSQLAIPYSDFIQIVPTFHQICSSQIISPAWYTPLAQFNKSLLLDAFQFEIAFGANYFQVLATFCALAKNTIADAYRIFSANTFINNRILSEALFSEQMKILTDAFTESTHNEFIRIFSLARNTIQINQLASQTFSNFDIFLYENSQVLTAGRLLTYLLPSFSRPFGICSCVSESNECGVFTYVYNLYGNGYMTYLPNLIVKCLPTETALASTLECWYSQTCSSFVLAAYAQEGIFDINETLPLDVNVLSRFPLNATMEIMMDELLLENWTITVSYDHFYNKCAPTSCVYTTEQRFDAFFVIVTILGVYSGLSESLRLVLPIIVLLVLFFLRYIRKRNYSVNPSISTERIQCNDQSAPAISRMTRIRQYISTYNLFETSSSTVQTLRQEILSTRLHLLLLIASTITLVFYTGLIERSKSETIFRPTQSTYEYFYQQYSNTLQCPCSNISISYNNFTIHLNATFHPICSSDFVSEEWYTYFNFYSTGYAWWLWLYDFRKWGSLFFQLLQSFCSLANSTVNDAVEQFKINSFITAEVIPATQFQVQINEVLGLFQKSISTLFARPLQVFRANDQGNALISLLGTNWEPMLGNSVSNAHLLSIPVTYNNGTCSCATSSSCIEPAAFYNISQTKIYIVNGIFTGCLCLESLLLSSLLCFFSNSCTSEFIDAMSLGIPSSFWKINPPNISSLPLLSPNSPFKVNDTIETIVNQLFIDTWSNETSYERYYNACAPSHCTYSYRRRLDVLYILTTFLSVFNGLSIGLHFAVRYIMKMAYKVRNCFGT